jgi:hypothetical protein
MAAKINVDTFFAYSLQKSTGQKLEFLHEGRKMVIMLLQAVCYEYAYRRYFFF